MTFDAISFYVRRESINYGGTQNLVIAAMSVKTSSMKAVLYGYGRNFGSALNDNLSARGFEVEVPTQFHSAIPSLREAHLVFFHISGDSFGDEKKFQSIKEEVQVLRITRSRLPIFCTSNGKEIDRIVLLIKAGATDHETWTEPFERLPAKIEQFLDNLSDLDPSKEVNLEKSGFNEILGQSTQIQRVFDMISKVSATASTVLITGESGTGKELVCRAIHKMSSRKNGPLIPVNCAAIPEELLESEIFGHEKGAFTGATTARDGRFQLANNGTIFLDGVGEMNPKLQMKFLRVLQESEFERVGGSKTIRVDVRVIAATNKDIEKAVEKKEFREDLFYRLNVIPIHLPSLRERQEDISILFQYFMGKLRENGLSKIGSLHPKALDALQTYSWPGNVRELENLIERMSVLVEKPVLHLEDLPDRFRNDKITATSSAPAPEMEFPDGGIDLKAVMDEFESNLILKALEKSGGVKNRAAQLLSLNRTTLVEKLKKKNLDIESTA